jgi:aerobic carbon-monoxide dehydrogenase medium subunit
LWRRALRTPCSCFTSTDDEARILAGGQSLMPALNMRLSQPRVLIDINRLDALGGITRDGNRARIGALARDVEVATSPLILEHVPLVAEAMPHVAVRNRGTFGGSIALADPTAELSACALGAGGHRGRAECARPARDRAGGLLSRSLRDCARTG